MNNLELKQQLIDYKTKYGCTWKWMAQEMSLGYKTLTNFTSGYREKITDSTRSAIIDFLETHK